MAEYEHGVTFNNQNATFEYCSGQMGQHRRRGSILHFSCFMQTAVPEDAATLSLYIVSMLLIKVKITFQFA